MTETPEFDLDAAFDDDYLHCYAGYLTDQQDDDDAALIAGLLELRPGQRVLDLCCGHGRIATRLAALGCAVTGLDRSPLFLARARGLATTRGVDVHWLEQDVRTLDVSSSFDAIACWFTSFGYFGDTTDRDLLRRMHRALAPGGRLLLETMNLFHAVNDIGPSIKHGGTNDLMIDESHYDPTTGRKHIERTVVRQGRPQRQFTFSVRLLACTELRDWLLDAGFTRVEAYGGDGEPFELDSERLIVVAHTA